MIIVDENQYKKAFREVLVILNLIPNEDYNKIPTNIILILQKFQDTSYDYKLDFNKEFKEQNISEVSKAILANFYRDYWATDTEKNKLIEKENAERIQLEYEKRKKYNPDDIFKASRKEKVIDSEDNNVNKSLIIKKEENIFQKLLNKVKKYFLK